MTIGTQRSPYWGKSGTCFILLYVASERQKEREPVCQRTNHLHPLFFFPALSREVAPHGSNSCNPPSPTLATNTLFSFFLNWVSAPNFQQYAEPEAPLPQLEALTGWRRAGGRGSCLKMSMEAIRENGTATEFGRGWAVGCDSRMEKEIGGGHRDIEVGSSAPRNLPPGWLCYTSSLLLMVSSPVPPSPAPAELPGAQLLSPSHPSFHLWSRLLAQLPCLWWALPSVSYYIPLEAV